MNVELRVGIVISKPVVLIPIICQAQSVILHILLTYLLYVLGACLFMLKEKFIHKFAPNSMVITANKKRSIKIGPTFLFL